MTLYLLVLLVVGLVVFIKCYVGTKPTPDLTVFDYKPPSATTTTTTTTTTKTTTKTTEKDEATVVRKDASSSSLRHRTKPVDENIEVSKPIEAKNEKEEPAKENTEDIKKHEEKAPEKVEVEEKQEKHEILAEKEEEKEDEKEEEKEDEKEEEKKEEEVKNEDKEEKSEDKEEKGEDKEEKSEGEDEEDKEDEENEDEDEDEDEDDDDDDEDESNKANLREVINSNNFGKVLVVSVSLQGKRPKNEDRIIMESSANSHFCGVFDGHDGAKASNYCTKYMVKNITSQKSYGKSLEQAIKAGFLLTDKKFLAKLESGGTTAIMAVLDQACAEMVVANAGDSRAIAAVDGVAVPLSTDHKPNLPEETERVNKTVHEVITTTEIVNGQRVKIARIDGQLAVSRALGDSEFKDDDDKPQNQQAVSAEPDLLTVKITPQHEFVVLACDGLWDVLSNQEVVDFVKSRISETTTKEELIAVTKSLVSHAIEDKRSTDNVTALILKF